MWLESLRPKALPLTSATIIVRTALVQWQNHFDPLVVLLTLIVAGLLQTLSNFANGYGDAIKGSDKPDRIRSLRGTQKGVTTQQEMKRALIITVVLICLSGLALAAMVCHALVDSIGLLILGGLSIIVAIVYTVGSRPYGYIDSGDISVLVFFGQLSVMGSWYLQAHTSIPILIPPATACDLLVTAVLNINNLRDIDSDRENDKNTLVTRLGAVNACRYHACLPTGSLVCLASSSLFSLHSLWGWPFLLTTSLLMKQARYMMREVDLVAV